MSTQLYIKSSNNDEEFRNFKTVVNKIIKKDERFKYIKGTNELHFFPMYLGEILDTIIKDQFDYNNNICLSEDLVDTFFRLFTHDYLSYILCTIDQHMKYHHIIKIDLKDITGEFNTFLNAYTNCMDHNLIEKIKNRMV